MDGKDKQHCEVIDLEYGADFRGQTHKLNHCDATGSDPAKRVLSMRGWGRENASSHEVKKNAT
jgi:hypothetical protein